MMNISSILFFKKLYVAFFYLFSGLFLNAWLRFFKKFDIFSKKFFYWSAEHYNWFIDNVIDYDVWGLSGGKVAVGFIGMWFCQHIVTNYLIYLNLPSLETEDEVFFDDYVDSRAYASGLKNVTDPFEEWENCDNAVDLEDTDYDEDPQEYAERFSFVNDEEYDGDEGYDNGLDMPPDVPYFNNHYNAGEIIDNIDWRQKWASYGPFSK